MMNEWRARASAAAAASVRGPLAPRREPRQVRRRAYAMAPPDQLSVDEKCCGGVPLSEVATLQRRLRWRHSPFRRRRALAYAACLRLIQFREAALMIGQPA